MGRWFDGVIRRLKSNDAINQYRQVPKLPDKMTDLQERLDSNGFEVKGKLKRTPKITGYSYPHTQLVSLDNTSYKDLTDKLKKQEAENEEGLLNSIREFFFPGINASNSTLYLATESPNFRAKYSSYKAKVKVKEEDLKKKILGDGILSRGCLVEDMINGEVGELEGEDRELLEVTNEEYPRKVNPEAWVGIYFGAAILTPLVLSAASSGLAHPSELLKFIS